jgi:hypothetical protein
MADDAPIPKKKQEEAAPAPAPAPAPPAEEEEENAVIRHLVGISPTYKEAAQVCMYVCNDDEQA